MINRLLTFITYAENTLSDLKESLHQLVERGVLQQNEAQTIKGLLQEIKPKARLQTDETKTTLAFV